MVRFCRLSSHRQADMSAAYYTPSPGQYVESDLPWHRKQVTRGRNPWSIVWDETQEPEEEEVFEFTAECQPSIGCEELVPTAYSVPRAYFGALTIHLFPSVLQKDLQDKQEKNDDEHKVALQNWEENGYQGQRPTVNSAEYSEYALKSWWQSTLVFRAFLSEVDGWKASSSSQNFTMPSNWRSKVLHCWLWRQHMAILNPKQHYPVGRAAFKKHFEAINEVPYAGDVLQFCEFALRWFFS